MAGGWEFPGGKAEPGESDADALVRECEEELGVHIEVGEQVGADVPLAGGASLLRVYLARLVGDARPRALEHSALRWLAASELDDPASWAQSGSPAHAPAMSGASVPGGEEAAAAGVQASTTAEWHHQSPMPQGPALGPDGRLPVSEVAMDRSGAASPYGDDVTFPLPPEELSYRHPE